MNARKCYYIIIYLFNIIEYIVYYSHTIHLSIYDIICNALIYLRTMS